MQHYLYILILSDCESKPDLLSQSWSKLKQNYFKKIMLFIKTLTLKFLMSSNENYVFYRNTAQDNVRLHYLTIF